MRAIGARIAAAATFAVWAASTGCTSDAVDGQPGEAASGADSADPQAEQNLDGRGPITFATTRNDGAVMGPIIDSWNEAHPDEKVTLKELHRDADMAQDQLIQSLQSGNGDFDVMTLDLTWTSQFASEGWLQPLDGTLALDTSGLFPAVVASATISGTLYAAPVVTNTQLLFYRTDLTPQAPADWQSLLDSCTIAENQDVDCLLAQLMPYEGLTISATQFIHSWGGSVVSEDGTTPTVGSERAKAGLQALVQAYESEAIAKRCNRFDEAATAAAFAAGEAMYAYNWPYMATVVEDADLSKVAGKVGVAPIPGPDGVGVGTLGGYHNGIDIHSQHKATALDFVTFLLGEDSQRVFAEQSFPPVRVSMYEDAALTAQHPYFPVLREALESAQARPLTPRYAAVSGAIQRNVNEVLKRSSTVDDAAAGITNRISEVYE